MRARIASFIACAALTAAGPVASARPKCADPGSREPGPGFVEVWRYRIGE